MKIDVNKIPLEGLTLKEEIAPSALDLETDIVKIPRPVNVTAKVSRITNAVTVDLNLTGLLFLSCGRCLNEFSVPLDKKLTLSYQADDSKPIIDLDQEIKEEIILDYPIKPLCSPGCKGLCPKCGKNLNEGGCTCAIT